MAPTGGFKGQRAGHRGGALLYVPHGMKKGDDQPQRLSSSSAGAARLCLRDPGLGRECVSLSLASPEFGPRKLYANLGRAAGQDDENVYAVIWNPAD